MKKSNSALASLYLIVAVNVFIVSSCIKNDVPVPDTTPAVVSFNANLSGTGVVLYSNRSPNTAGSFFSFSTGVSTPTAAGNTNFRLIDKGTNTAPGLYFANTYTDGQSAIDPTNFATSGLNFATATAQGVLDAGTPGIAEIQIFASPVFLFQTNSGLKGILSVDSVKTDSNPSGTVITQKVIFSYKIVAN